jgi:hypothetical protein
MAGEPEVVVRGEVDQAAPVALDDRGRRTVDGDEAAPKARFVALGEPALELGRPGVRGDSRAGQVRPLRCEAIDAAAARARRS